MNTAALGCRSPMRTNANPEQNRSARPTHCPSEPTVQRLFLADRHETIGKLFVLTLLALAALTSALTTGVML
ncbi:hypothetical protein [Halomarina oriensis]|uniref:Uncharacterized protein n=1 Tax=Halomarina oriensis TaxID=671145 RepID=A0A6B0GMM5_9EURY|nr:hypothetical protein [Halomarina oriensis]MWG35910.1 hypothetical protein [Halomarina oriensis]